MAQKPWEKYSSTQTSEVKRGPWDKYASQPKGPKNDPSLTPDVLDSGSVANIANPSKTAFEQPLNSNGTYAHPLEAAGKIAKSGLNLVGALGEGAEKSLGIDPGNQVSTGISSVLSSAKQVGEGVHDLETGNMFGVYDKAKGFLSGLVQPVEDLYRGFKENDPDKFVSGLGGTAGTTLPAIMGGVEQLKQPLKNAYANIKDLPEPVIHPLTGEQVGSTPRTPRTGLFSNEVDPKTKFAQSNPPKYAADMAQAHGGQKAYWLRDRLEQATQDASNDLKAGERDILKGPVTSAEEHYRLLPLVKDKVWAEYKQYLDKGNPIAGNDIIKRAMNGIDEGTRINHPNEVAALESDLMERYAGKTYTPEAAQKALSSLNSEAKNFYRQSNTDKASASKLIAASKWEAPADAIRGLLDESLPDGGASVRKRFGALSELQEEMPPPSHETPSLAANVKAKLTHGISTRMGYAAARGVAEHLTNPYSDRLIKNAYAKMPETSATNSGPGNIHPLAPQGITQRIPVNPLSRPKHPLEVPQLRNTGLPSGMIEHKNPIPFSQPRPVIAPDLSSINRQAPALPIENNFRGIQHSQPNHPMTALPVNQLYPQLPQNNPLGVVQSQAPPAPLGIAGERTGGYPVNSNADPDVVNKKKIKGGLR